MSSGGFGFGYALTPVVKRLLVANAAVFFVTLVAGAEFQREVVYPWLGFQPSHVLTRPWGAFTYMFVHGGFIHVFVNMLALFFFGPALEARWGGREFFRFYVVAGLGGAALSFVFAPNAAVIGASAAVYGVMLAFAMNWPDAPIYIWGIFPVKAKWLVAFMFVVTLFSAFDGPGGAVAHFAHLGGIVTAFLYLKMDWRGKQQLERLKKSTRKVRRLAIVPREEEDEVAESRSVGSWSKADERRLLDAVDRVLDKISEKGMASLTAEERRILDEAAR
ncbi:MAG: rhomboid family intramembrane serine protease, partial [Gemmatimonadota bacterium]